MISSIDPEAFHSLSGLKVLHLHNNQLQTLDISVFPPGPVHVPTEAAKHRLLLSLSGNLLRQKFIECGMVFDYVVSSKFLAWDYTVRLRPGMLDFVPPPNSLLMSNDSDALCVDDHHHPGMCRVKGDPVQLLHFDAKPIRIQLICTTNTQSDFTFTIANSDKRQF